MLITSALKGAMCSATLHPAPIFMKRPVAYAIKHQTLPDTAIPLKVKVKIRSSEQCEGYFVHPKNITTRRPGALGHYRGFVPGAGGDVWWVIHEDSTVAAYQVDELTDRRY